MISDLLRPSHTRISPDSSFAATRRRKADTERLSRSACFRNVFRVRSSKARLVFFCSSFEGIQRSLPKWRHKVLVDIWVSVELVQDQARDFPTACIGK